MKELDKAIQISFNNSDMSLEAMNQSEYVMLDTLTSEEIPYGTTFLLFRGRVFKSFDTFHKWLWETSREKVKAITLEDKEFQDIWEKKKRMRKNIGE